MPWQILEDGTRLDVFPIPQSERPPKFQPFAITFKREKCFAQADGPIA